MGDKNQQSPYQHDAFISYSRKDKPFAIALERALEAYTPPRTLQSSRRRLDIFRDEQDFTGTEYHQSLDHHLRRSKKLLVLCSPHARESPYVNDEIQRFARARGAENIVPLLLSGVPNNEANVGNEQEKAFPEALYEFMAMPLAADYRDFTTAKRYKVNKTPFENAWYTVLANLYDRSRSEVEERDKRKKAHNRRIGIGILLLAIVILAWLYLRAEWQRQIAEQQRRTARAGELAAHSQAALMDFPQRSLLLAVEALQITRRQGERRHIVSLLGYLEQLFLQITRRQGERRHPAAEAALREALARTGGHNLGGHKLRINAVETSPDSRWLLTSDDDTTYLWDLTAADPTMTRHPLHGAHALRAIAFSPNSRWLVTANDGSTLTGQTRTTPDAAALLWDLTLPLSTLRPVMLGGKGELPMVGDLLARGRTDFITKLLIGPDSRWLVSQSFTTTRLWDLTATEPSFTAIDLTYEERLVSPVTISNDSRWLITRSDQDVWHSQLHVWDLTADKPSATVRLFPGKPVRTRGIFTTPDKRWLVTEDSDQALHLWHLTAADPTAASVRLSQDGEADFRILLSQDSHWLVVGKNQRTVQLWDLHTSPPQAPTHEWTDDKRAFNVLGLSPNNRWLVSESADHRVYFWDLTTDDPRSNPYTRNQPTRATLPFEFSPDGHWFATGGDSDSSRLWDLTAADPTSHPLPLAGHVGAINWLTISADSRWLITGSRAVGTSGYDTIRLWDLTAKEPPIPTSVVGTHESLIEDITISRDSRWLITRSHDRDSEDLRKVQQLMSLRQGHTAQVTSSRDSGRLWNLTTTHPTSTSIMLRGHESRIYDVAISSDNRWVITRSHDRTARLWDLTAPDPARDPLTLPRGEYADIVMALSPDNHWLVARSADNTALVMDLTAPAPTAASLSLELPSRLQFAHISPGNQWLILGADTDTAYLWRLPIPSSDTPPVVVRPPEGEIADVVMSPDNRWLVTTTSKPDTSKNTTLLWDLTAASHHMTPIPLSGHKGSIDRMVISPDSRWLVTGSNDDTARVWNLTAKNPASSPRILQGVAKDPERDPEGGFASVLRGQDSVNILAISPDSRWLVTSGSFIKTARLWDLAARHSAPIPRVLRGHTTAIDNIIFSPDSRWLVTSGEDDHARLWNLTAADPSTTGRALRGHRTVFFMSISSDSSWLITSGDATARVWDLTVKDPASTPPIVLSGHDAPITGIAISPDNHWLVTGSEDATARVWNLRLGELIDLACETAGRNLHWTEHEQYRRGEPYYRTCATFPPGQDVPLDALIAPDHK